MTHIDSELNLGCTLKFTLKNILINIGSKIYKYIQMSSKYKVENDENNLEFPVLFGTWVKEEQTISLYLSPDKCKDGEFIIES